MEFQDETESQDTPTKRSFPSTSSLTVSHPQNSQRGQGTCTDEYDLLLGSGQSMSDYSSDVGRLAWKCLKGKIHEDTPKLWLYTCPSQVKLRAGTGLDSGKPAPLLALLVMTYVTK